MTGKARSTQRSRSQEDLKTTIKSSAKRLINWVVDFLGKVAIGRYLYERIIDNAMDRVQQVEHRGVSLVFAVPNPLNRYRVATFSTKVPETLEWIDGISSDSTVWDIGANIGLYTCYAAKARGCRVYAFEPSVFNLELLARNIFLNRLTDRVTIIPLPLSEALAVNTLNMTTTQWGGAMSTFGQTYGHDGQPMRKVFEFPTIGLSMVDAVELLQIPRPAFIKMDVDGIEHLILKGGPSILQGVKGILIEINDQFAAQANEASRCLQQAGFVLKEKRHADYFDRIAGSARFSFNQIWFKEVSSPTMLLRGGKHGQAEGWPQTQDQRQ
jgi:FkbM family methyltransferase